MTNESKKAVRKGKRVTPEIQTQVVMEAISSTKDLASIIEEYKLQGFNFDDGVEDSLKSIEKSEISFMLANRNLLKSIKDEAISHFINNMQTK